MTESSQADERLVADGESRWWQSEEGVKMRRRIETEVRRRHAGEFARAGWFRELLLELRVRREIAAEMKKVCPLETLWLGR
jgi:hypothetical protein